MPNDVDAMVEKLERALTGPDGNLVRVDRIEFERIGRGLVRWSLFSGGRRIYTATDRPGNLAGWLTCSNVLLQE